MTIVETRRRTLRMLGALGTCGMLSLLGTGPALGADKGRRSPGAAALVVVDVENCIEQEGAPPMGNRHDVLPLLDRLLDLPAFDHVLVAKGSASFANARRDAEPFLPLKLATDDNTPWPSRCVRQSGKMARPDGLAGCLRERRVKTVFIASPVNAVCVGTMALDARKAGLRTFFIEDAAGGPTDPDGASAMWRAKLDAGGVRRIRIADIPRL